MKATPATKSLDQIVTDSALLWVRRRIAARALESKPYTLVTLAQEMAAHFETREPTPPEWHVLVDRVQQTVGRYLGISRRGKATWRLDYLEAFCRAMGVPVSELVEPSGQLSDEDMETIARYTRDATWANPRGEKCVQSSEIDLEP